MSPPQQLTGGLDIAVADLAAQLRLRGWEIDVPLGAISEGDIQKDSESGTSDTFFPPAAIRPPSFLERLRRSRALSALRLPRFLKGYFSLVVDRSTIAQFNQNLFSLERMLKRSPAPDAVLLFTSYATPGVCALVLHQYPAAVLIDLSALAFELKLAKAWSMMRHLSALRLPQPIHPFLYRAARPEQMRFVSFASRAWHDDALRYGLNPSSGHIIYFGVPTSPVAARPAPRGRLLWVGRMNPGKGLQHFVRAMPAIRSAVPESRLTAIARREDDAYAAVIAKDAARLRLGDALQIVPGVDRAELQRAYAESDLLLCISPFSEPVPLVMMEAYTAGLPVIISRPGVASPLARDGETCICFDIDSPQTLVDAIVRLHRDGELRDRLVANARKLVEDHFSLDATGAEYDTLLRRAADYRSSRLLKKSLAGWS